MFGTIVALILYLLGMYVMTQHFLSMDDLLLKVGKPTLSQATKIKLAITWPWIAILDIVTRKV